MLRPLGILAVVAVAVVSIWLVVVAVDAARDRRAVERLAARAADRRESDDPHLLDAAVDDLVTRLATEEPPRSRGTSGSHRRTRSTGGRRRR